MTKKTHIPQQRDAADVVACTCTNLRQAARVMTQAYDDALRPAGLRSTQFSLLATLARRGDIAVTRLADVLVMDRTTLTRNLKPLVRRDLIRIEHEDDQRVRIVSLTDAGRQVFEDAMPRWKQIQLQISEKLGPERWSGFLDDLTAAVSAVRDR